MPQFGVLAVCEQLLHSLHRRDHRALRLKMHLCSYFHIIVTGECVQAGLPSTGGGTQARMISHCRFSTLSFTYWRQCTCLAPVWLSMSSWNFVQSLTYHVVLLCMGINIIYQLFFVYHRHFYVYLQGLGKFVLDSVLTASANWTDQLSQQPISYLKKYSL